MVIDHRVCTATRSIRVSDAQQMQPLFLCKLRRLIGRQSVMGGSEVRVDVDSMALQETENRKMLRNFSSPLRL